MAGKSNFWEAAIIDYTFRGVALPTFAGSLYVGLFTAAPTDAGGGTEVSGGSYARAAITRATGTFSAASGTPRSVANVAAIVFPSPTANWGTVTHIGVFDAATTGNLLYWVALGTSRNILNGDVAPQFGAGVLTASED